MRFIKGIKFLLIPIVLFFAYSCSEDEVPSVAFQQVTSTYYEENGTGNISIPLRASGSISEGNVNLIFEGTATLNEDYELVSFSSTELVIKVIDDNLYEELEYVRIRLESNGADIGGNAIHTLYIVSDCEDTVGLDVAFFAGNYDAIEDYGAGGTYGPYTITLVQDETEANRFSFNNFYDSGCSAFMVFNFTAGTVNFPNQSPCSVPLTNSSGTFSIDLCDGVTTITIGLNFDGGDWTYRFTKK